MHAREDAIRSNPCTFDAGMWDETCENAYINTSQEGVANGERHVICATSLANGYYGVRVAKQTYAQLKEHMLVPGFQHWQISSSPHGNSYTCRHSILTHVLIA